MSGQSRSTSGCAVLQSDTALPWWTDQRFCVPGLRRQAPLDNPPFTLILLDALGSLVHQANPGTFFDELHFHSKVEGVTDLNGRNFAGVGRNRKGLGERE